MQISPLTRAHCDDAAALWHRAGLTRPWNSPEGDFQRALDGETSTVLGGFDDGCLIGTAMVGHDGHRGWVYYLAVDESRRGAGLGAQLMAAAETWLREQGAVKVQLMVRAENDAAVGFYDRLGYDDVKVAVRAKWLV
jgi:ribosomal protein S18 acetylase RimI-like enzyme